MQLSMSSSLYVGTGTFSFSLARFWSSACTSRKVHSLGFIGAILAYTLKMCMLHQSSLKWSAREVCSCRKLESSVLNLIFTSSSRLPMAARTLDSVGCGVEISVRLVAQPGPLVVLRSVLTSLVISIVGAVFLFVFGFAIECDSFSFILFLVALLSVL